VAKCPNCGRELSVHIKGMSYAVELSLAPEPKGAEGGSPSAPNRASESRPPTERQLRYIEDLARRLHTTVMPPTSADAASAVIEDMKRRLAAERGGERG